MKADVKEIILNLRLQYYVPFVLLSGYFIWNPEPQRVSANQGQNSLPIVNSDPSTWPQPELFSPPQPTNSTPPTELNSTNLPSNLIFPTEPEAPSFSIVESGVDSTESFSFPTLPKPTSPHAINEESDGFPSLKLNSLDEKKSPHAINENSDNFPSPNLIDPEETEDLTSPSQEKTPSFLQETPSLLPKNIRVSPSEIEKPLPQKAAIPRIINPYKPDEYRFTIGDTISIFIANIPEFTTKNIIDSDGKINLPVAGPIYIWDMTVEEAEVAVRTRYMETQVLQNPDVSIKRLASSPLKIAIAGKINRPGAYDVPVLDKKLPTITEALKVAGGIASEADLRNVELYRHNRSGGQELFKINLHALYEKADLSQNVTLRSGDRIIIPKATIRPDEAKLIGSANVSPDTMQIGLLGEVLNPGIIQAPTNTSLNQALILVGGLNGRATKKIHLVRTNDDGTVTREKIKIDWAANVGDPKNPVLHHRDVVLVGKNAIAKYSDFLEKALGPINRTVPFIGILDLLFPGNRNN